MAGEGTEEGEGGRFDMTREFRIYLYSTYLPNLVIFIFVCKNIQLDVGKYDRFHFLPCTKMQIRVFVRRVHSKQFNSS
jgi:hypothetical protein